MAPRLSVIVATRNRAASLRPMLASLAAAVATAGEPVEVIIVDNGSSDDTSGIVEQWCVAQPGRVPLSVCERGKARALNTALRAAHGEIVGFTDDDVVVPSNWPSTILAFMTAHADVAAMTGRITLPADVTDRRVLDQIALYRTLPLFDEGDAVHDTKHLYGCNMAIRRATFDALGGFNEQLGPGASGLHEDGDFAARMRAAGLRIAYVPALTMHHLAEASRLTWDFFVTMHHADARSRFAQLGRRGVRFAARHWLGAAVTWLWWTLLRNPQRQMRARGRLLSYRELLRLEMSPSA